MHPFFESYLDNLQELHDGIRAALAGLPPEALDWTPGPGCNSVTQLITHIAGAERFWIGDVIAGEPSHRDRDGEFLVRQVDADALLRKLALSLDYNRSVLEKLSLDDLASIRHSSRKRSEVSVAWALGHTLKHTAEHLGHLELTIQLFFLK